MICIVRITFLLPYDILVSQRCGFPMSTENKQEWITPELVEYGDVVKVTEGKVFISGDGFGIGQDTGWLSGTKPGKEPK